ncbi:13412_t:CDS:2, partial [Gigaspora rosea]
MGCILVDRITARLRHHTQIIPPDDEPGEIGLIADINLYISKRPIDVDEEFFLRPLKNYSGVDVQAGMSITKHRTIEAYNMYREIAKLVVPLGTKKPTTKIMKATKMINNELGENNDQDNENNETDKVNEEIDQNNEPI